ncbi:hypothetical protein OROMI_023052 [Orobanche minor]
MSHDLVSPSPSFLKFVCPISLTIHKPLPSPAVRSQLPSKQGLGQCDGMSELVGNIETMHLTETDAELSSDKQPGSPAPVDSKLMPTTPVPVGSTPVKSSTPPAPVESKSMEWDHKSPQASAEEILEHCKDELLDLQEKCDLLESQHLARLDTIKASYVSNIEPVYANRSRIILGENEKATRIPNFWFIVMKEACIRLGVSSEITDLDEAVFEYLKDIKFTPLDQPEGWKLDFFFDFRSNPYFENNLLTKEVRYTMFRGQKIYNELKGTKIEWRSGRCLTLKAVKRMNKRYLVEATSFL